MYIFINFEAYIVSNIKHISINNYYDFLLRP